MILFFVNGEVTLWFSVPFLIKSDVTELLIAGALTEYYFHWIIYHCFLTSPISISRRHMAQEGEKQKQELPKT